MHWKSIIINQLNTSLNTLDIQLNRVQEEQICTYYQKLKEWNTVMNLTAIVDEVEFATKHIMDSIAAVKFIDFSEIENVIDIGTGAGLPGIVLKIFFPHLKITLVDSLNKRINFLNELIKELAFEDIIAVHGRAEDLGQDPAYREQFDCCVSRAVSQLPILSEYCIPFIKVDGKFVAYKSINSDEEIEASKYAINVLGASIYKVEDIELMDGQMPRRFVIIHKNEHTINRFPRRPGVAQKKPLLES